MSTALLDHQTQAGAGNGGVPARRAVIRWAWRMFRREWRQQTLVLALIVVALAATVVGAAVATNTPPPAGAGFGTAQDMATLPGGPHLASQIAVLQQDVGPVGSVDPRQPGVHVDAVHLHHPEQRLARVDEREVDEP